MTTVRVYAEKLVQWEWLALLGLLALAVLPNGPARLVLLAVPALWLVNWLTKGRILPSTPFNLSIWLMLIMTVISLLFTFDPATSVPKIAVFLVGIAMFGSATYIARTQANGIWYIFAFVVATGAMMALVGLFGTPWTGLFEPLNLTRTSLPVAWQTVPGAIGGLVNTNELAGVLVWLAPLMVASTLGLRRPLWRKHRLWYVSLLACTGLVLGVLVATQSRGGIVALLAGILTVAFLMVRSRWRIVLAILTGVLAITSVLAIRSAPESSDIFSDTLGLDSRLEIWERGIDALTDYPITGVSFNGFRRVVHALYPTFLVPESVDLAHAHNHLLQTALDLGIPGLVAYLAIWFLSGVLIWEAMGRLRRSRSSDHPYYSLLAGLGGSMIAGWTFGLVDAIALGARPSFVWWLLLAMIASLHYTVMNHPRGYFRRRRSRDETYGSEQPAVESAPSPALETAPAPPATPSSLQPPSPPPGASRPRIRSRRPSETGLDTQDGSTE